MSQKKTELIKELILNSRRSDRDLAKEIKVTQPTVGRIRKTIEKENYLSGYTATPNLSKINIELIAFTTLKWTDYNKTDKLRQFEDFIRKSDLTFFSAPGEGFNGKTKIMMTFHKDYKNYELFLRSIRADWAKLIDEMDTFLVSTSNIIKNFDFKGLTHMISDVNEKKD